MAKRIVLYIFLALICLPQNADSQRWKMRRYETLLGVGFANYFGDIGGAATRDNWFGIKDLRLSHTRPALYVGARYKIRPDVSVKLNMGFGWFAGTDANGVNNDRGFEFTTRFLEPSFQAEYSLISEEHKKRTGAMYNKRGMINNYSQINLYLCAGIGGVFFKPKVNGILENAYYYDPNHSRAAIVLPVGIGFKYVISEKWSIGGEFGVRWTTTDYLDGYTSPFSKANDLYYYAHIHGIYRVKTGRNGLPIFSKRRRY